MGMTQNLRHLLLKREDLSSHPYVHIRSQSRLLLVQSRGKWKLQGWWSWLFASLAPSSVRDSQTRQRVRKKDTQHPPIVASPHNIYTHHIYIYRGQTQQRREKDMSRHTPGKWVAIKPHNWNISDNFSATICHVKYDDKIFWLRRLHSKGNTTCKNSIVSLIHI